MKYTKQQRKQIAKALKLSLPYLWDGENYYKTNSRYVNVCGAVYGAWDNGQITTKARDLITDMIGERLGYAAVTTWLCFNGVSDIDNYKPYIVQTYRKRWMEAMIKEFSK